MIQNYIIESILFTDNYINSDQYVYKFNIPKVEYGSAAYIALVRMIREDKFLTCADMVRIFNINFKPYIIRILSFNPVTEAYVDIVLLNIILHFEPDLLLDDMEKIENLKKDYIYNKDSALSSLGFSILRQILSKVPIEIIYCK